MRISIGGLIAVIMAFIATPAFAGPSPTSGNTAAVNVKWTDIERVSDTVPTTQILAHAYTLRSNPLHDPLFNALQNLHTNDTRLQLWYSLPIQVVPELKPPTATETFWDFQYSDALVSDYYAHTSGRHHVNIGTVPRWMFNVPDVQIPSDPAASFYPYTEGTKGDLLKDPTGRQFAEYQVRIYQWYTRGGFTDELGKFHRSGHHYKIEYWGILNEPDFENKITVEQYTRIYDAVATAIHKIDPKVQFLGPEVAGAEVPWARYFLDPKNHAPDAPPLTYFAFHNYVSAGNDPSEWHDAYFTNTARSDRSGVSAQALAGRIQELIKIRDELSPKTRIIIDELGTFDALKPKENNCQADEPYAAYDPLYWNAIGANWAANFITSENLGIPLISMSQMDSYPSQCPSISMFDINASRPNAHYWALHLISHNFGPGDKLVATHASTSDIIAQASITPTGQKVLLINTTDRSISVDLAGAYKGSGLRANVVDQASGNGEPRSEALATGQVTLAPFAVAVVSGPVDRSR